MRKERVLQKMEGEGRRERGREGKTERLCVFELQTDKVMKECVKGKKKKKKIWERRE